MVPAVTSLARKEAGQARELLLSYTGRELELLSATEVTPKENLRTKQTRASPRYGNAANNRL